MGLSRVPDRYIDVLTCDGNCGAIVTEGRDHTATELAGSLGWVQVGKKWFCKECKAKCAERKD